MIKCELCGLELADPASAYHYVEGWESKRDQGGTNALRLRKPLNRHAHRHCVERAAKGIAATQEALGLD